MIARGIASWKWRYRANFRLNIRLLEPINRNITGPGMDVNRFAYATLVFSQLSNIRDASYYNISRSSQSDQVREHPPIRPGDDACLTGYYRSINQVAYLNVPRPLAAMQKVDFFPTELRFGIDSLEQARYPT